MSSLKIKTILEDINKELNVQNSVISKKTLLTLARVVKEAIPSGQIIDEKLEKTLCVQQLWNSCCHSFAFVASGSCQIWVNLIQEELAAVDYVVNGFVSRILSSNFEVAINMTRPLKELLVVQTKLSGQQIYQLRDSVHPFVIILQQKRELWPIIFDQMTSIIKQEPIDIVYLTLSPVLKHILWKHSSQFLGLKLALLNELWERINTSNHALLEEFLWKNIFWLKTDNALSMFESQLEISQMSKLYARSLSGNQRNLEELLLCIIAFSKKLTDHQIDIHSSLTHINLIALKLANVSATKDTDMCIVILCQLLNIVPETSYSFIISTCEILMSRKGVNPLVIGLLFVSVVISVNVSGQKSGSNRTNVPLLMNLLNKLEELLKPTNLSKEANEIQNESYFKSGNFNEDSLSAEQIVQLCDRLLDNPGETSRWLTSIDKLIDRLEKKRIHDSIIGLVCALICQPQAEFDNFGIGVGILIKLAQLDSDIAPSIFVVIMYKLKLEEDPNKRFVICKAIPHFATSKVCIGPILKTLMGFHKDASMKAVAIRLVSRLWLKQERIYPVLHKLLAEENDAKSLASFESSDVQLAKAASILDICKLKSHLYGSDLLTMLSTLVNNNSSKYSTPIAAIALESIILLCHEDVIDLKTTWDFLYSSLKSDRRPDIRIKLCQLLSLVAEKGLDEFDVFVEKSMSLLWEFGLSDEGNVSASAFKSLSNFKRSYFKLQYFPQEMVSKVEASLESKKEIHRNEDIVQDIPGYCFIDLLNTLTSDTIEGYGELLCKLTAQEVCEMPKSLLVLSRSSKSRVAYKDELIPKMLMEKSVKAASPNIESSLTLGLLFSFDLHSHSVKDKARIYTAKLEQFLLKVSLDVNDWRKCILYSAAWSNFMERLYYALVEARELQINIQKNQDDTDDNVLKNETPLWTRDKIFDIIKNVVRVNPSAHGNAMIALAGLCRAIYKHNLLIESIHRDGSEYMSHKHWIVEFTGVICKCLETQSDLISGAFSWCHPGSGAMSETIRIYTALAASQLSYTSERQLATNLLTSLQNGLYSDNRLFAKTFCYGLGLGQLIFNLTIEHSCDKHLIMDSAEKLKNYCYQNNETSTLGLGLVAAGFCYENAEDSDAFVKSVITYLEGRLNEESPLYEHLAASYVISITSATSANIISSERVCALFKRWNDQMFADSSERSRKVSYGLLLEYLTTIDANYVEIKNDLLNKWIKVSNEAEESTMKLNTLHGLFSLTNGCYENGYIFKKHRLQNQDVQSLIALLQNAANDDHDDAVRECSLWMLGCCYWRVSNSLGAKNEGPMDYSFLNNSSILKFIVKHLKYVINSENFRRKEVICVLLKCMRQTLSQPYPDLNWASYLEPLFHLSPEIQKLCIEVALARAPHSLSAKTLIISLLDNKVLATLQESNKLLVLQELKVIVKIANPSRLQLFFNQILRVAFQSDADVNTGVELLRGLTEAVAVANISSTILQVLHITISEILNYIKSDKKVLWDRYCDMCVSLPELVIEEIVSCYTADIGCSVKIIQFQCEMVVRGKFPLTWLNNAIDSISHLECNDEMLNAVNRCFLICLQSSTKHNNDIARINWLLELMGHIKDVVLSGAHSPDKTSKVITNLFNAFACAVLSWTDIRFLVFTVAPNIDNTNYEFIMKHLPLGLHNLLENSAWKSQSRKVIEWLFFLQPYIQTRQLRNSLKECLFNLRHCNEFKTSSLWIRLLDELEM